MRAWNNRKETQEEERKKKKRKTELSYAWLPQIETEIDRQTFSVNADIILI